MFRRVIWIGAIALVAAVACGKRGSSQSESDDAAAEVPVDDDNGDDAGGEDDGDGDADRAPVRAERPVFRLGPNRLLAHVHRGGHLFLDAGSASFARYMRFGMPAPRWRLRGLEGGVRVARPERLAGIEVPLTDAQAAAIEAIHIRIYTPEPRGVTLKVNGRKAGQQASAKLEAGWQTATIPVEAGRFTEGENFIAFELGRGKDAAVAWIQLGGEPSAARIASPVRYEAGAPSSDDSDDSGDSGESKAAPGGDDGDGDDDDSGAEAAGSAASGEDTDSASGEDDDGPGRFGIERDAGLIYYVQIPEGGRLIGDVTGEEAGDACTVAVHASGAGPSLTGTLAGMGDAVDLSSLAGEIVRLELTAQGCPEVSLTGAALTAAGAPRRRPDAQEPPPPPEIVILWVMDALRADRVPVFTPGARAEVPGFERLAKTGTVFRQYWVQGNESQTSHASVWTSLYPANHNVRTAGDGGTWKLAGRFAKLGELMKEYGYQTVGVTGNGYVTKAGGFGKGFDVWRNLMREGAAKRNTIPGADLYNLAVELLDARRANGPVFLFLGTIDTHAPWVGHEPWLSRYDPGPYTGVHTDAAWPANLGIRRGSMKCVEIPAKRDLQRISAIYDSAVSYQDQLLSTLIAQLAEWGVLDRTMLIATADHGEELWEHGRCGHGASLHETLVRVPLLIHYPPLLPGGEVVVEGAEGVDVLPTILQALGRPTFDAAQGQSLVDLAHGAGRGYPRPSYASQYEYAHAMRLGHWKARVGRSGVPDLYNLAIDPLEKTSVALTAHAPRRMLTDVMSLFLLNRARWNKRAWGVASNMTERGARELDRRAEP